MAGSLKTAFFNLVKYAANDITSWLTDFNGNMDKIDTALNQNKRAAQAAQDGVDNLESEYDIVAQTLANHTTAIDNNEKAIAANSASIKELGNDVNDIIVGNYLMFTLSSVTKIETLVTGVEFFARRIGNGIEANGVITLGQGTFHQYDRQVNNGVFNTRYFTDLIRFSGNPFNLPANSYLPISGINSQNDNGNSNYRVDYISICIVYLSDSGFTALGLVGTNTNRIEVEKYEARLIM